MEFKGKVVAIESFYTTMLLQSLAKDRVEGSERYKIKVVE